MQRREALATVLTALLSGCGSSAMSSIPGGPSSPSSAGPLYTLSRKLPDGSTIISQAIPVNGDASAAVRPSVEVLRRLGILQDGRMRTPQSGAACPTPLWYQNQHGQQMISTNILPNGVVVTGRSVQWLDINNACIVIGTQLTGADGSSWFAGSNYPNQPETQQQFQTNLDAVTSGSAPGGSGGSSGGGKPTQPQTN